MSELSAVPGAPPGLRSSAEQAVGTSFVRTGERTFALDTRREDARGTFTGRIELRFADNVRSGRCTCKGRVQNRQRGPGVADFTRIDAELAADLAPGPADYPTIAGRITQTAAQKSARAFPEVDAVLKTLRRIEAGA